MAVLPILVTPDPVLREISEPVDQVDDDLRRLMDDLLETMYAAPGVGLSAIQVGIPKRVMVIDCAGEGEAAHPLYLVNPEVTWRSEEETPYEEGCLSVPEQYAEVWRPGEIEVSYLDYEGAEQTLRCDGLTSTCIQHEIDHFDGKLFIDYLSPLKRRMLLRKLKKAQKAKEPA